VQTEVCPTFGMLTYGTKLQLRTLVKDDCGIGTNNHRLKATLHEQHSRAEYLGSIAVDASRNLFIGDS